TMATGRTSCSCATLSSSLRLSCCTLVASITVSRPAASRLVAMKCKTSKASRLADWSFSSSATSPRQKSLEITSVGAKCARANVDFPEPLAPMSTTRLSPGTSITRPPTAGWLAAAALGSRSLVTRHLPKPRLPTSEDRHLGRRPDLRILRTHRQELDYIAALDGNSLGPRGELAAGPLETMIAMPHRARRQE